MATSMTHKYIPRIEQTEENLFMEEYYSSTDTKIYMDDVEQSEIAYISYSLREQLKPLYGYSSRTFDDVAVGNRIVTGMFKVPIKNPEAQTPMGTIIERSHKTTLEDYNENQQELMDAVDWITGEKDIYTDTIPVEDDNTFDYRTKLIHLGYDLDYNSSAYVLQQQIKQFQKDHGLYEDGLLTTSTMNAIDKAMSESSAPKMHLPKGTKIYLKPTFGSSCTVLTEAQDVHVLDISYDDGWVYIMTADGTEGYVNTEEVET
jgi:hypothetical protein